MRSLAENIAILRAHRARAARSQESFPMKLNEQITAALIEQTRYGKLAAEALGRAWAHLGRDRGWPDDQVVTLALEAATAGVMPDTVRAVTELTGKILQLGPAQPAKRPRKVAAAPAPVDDDLKVRYDS